MTDSAQGATLTFGTSAWTGNLLAINGENISRAALPTSNLSTTGYKTFTPADLVDPGQSTVRLQFDPDDPPPITGAAETITITFPIPSGLTNGATRACSGFLTDFGFDLSGGDDESVMEATFSVKWTGTPTWTDAS